MTGPCCAACSQDHDGDPGRLAGLAQEAWLVAANLPELVAAVTAATVGAVLASRRPRHPVGWLLLGLGLSFCLAGVTSGYSRYGLVARPGALPAAAWLVGVVVGAGSLVGRYRRARGTGRLQLRWLALAAAVSTAALLVAVLPITVLEGDATQFAVGFGVSLAVLPLATGASILRYRLLRP